VRLVVLGYPVGHSFSPAVHESALTAAGISGTYEACEVDDHGMVRAVSDVRVGVLDGANVTMPHKQVALALSDRAHVTARRAGAANTLVREGDDVVAYNTDIDGIRTAWQDAGLPDGDAVLILGSGGAAGAALLALEGHDLVVSARNAAMAHKLIAATGVAARVLPWGSGLDDSVLVNATPIGMQLEEHQHSATTGSVGVFDMAYGQGPTPLVRHAMARGLPYADGEDMLIAQAAISFEMWTGTPADRAAMRRGLDRERARRRAGD